MRKLVRKLYSIFTNNNNNNNNGDKNEVNFIIRTTEESEQKVEYSSVESSLNSEKKKGDDFQELEIVENDYNYEMCFQFKEEVISVKSTSLKDTIEIAKSMFKIRNEIVMLVPNYLIITNDYDNIGGDYTKFMKYATFYDNQNKVTTRNIKYNKLKNIIYLKLSPNNEYNDDDDDDDDEEDLKFVNLLDENYILKLKAILDDRFIIKLKEIPPLNDDRRKSKLFLRLINDEKLHSIEVPLSMKLSEFRLITCCYSNLSPSHQRFIFAGKQLNDDEKTLEAYDITKESIIHVAIRICMHTNYANLLSDIEGEYEAPDIINVNGVGLKYYPCFNLCEFFETISSQIN